MPPATSVIIPCYNGEAFLGEALASVRAQTRPVREVIVVDDGSTVPVSTPAAWDGPELTIVRTPNRGLPATRNLGLTRAAGEFVAFLDADDLWLPRKIETQEDALRADPAAVAVYTRCAVEPGFFGFGPYPPADVGDDEFILGMWYNLFFPPSAVLARRDAVEAVGRFREDLGNGEDIELWMRLLTRGRIAQVPEPLTRYRQHDQQFTKNTVKKLLGSKQARAAMIDQHRDRLIRAGVPADRLWDSYRNDILLVYYRRDFASARRLLWDYWRDHPDDLTVLRYALLSRLPAAWLRRLRGDIGTPATTAAVEPSSSDDRWGKELARIRHALRG